MKVQRSSRIAGLEASRAHARKLELIEPQAGATLAGIPEADLTPPVRKAVTGLMADADELRRKLEHLTSQLELAERWADQDQLLPLLNRRAFVRELTRAIAFSARYGTPASLVYFDLDDFKKVNDAYGHAAGDALLTHVAAILLQHVRDSDVVARLGGDEFAIILAHTTQPQAEAKAASLAETLAGSPARWHGKDIDVAFSCGVLQLGAGECADTAIARADEAMYARKRAAR